MSFRYSLTAIFGLIIAVTAMVAQQQRMEPLSLAFDRAFRPKMRTGSSHIAKNTGTEFPGVQQRVMSPVVLAAHQFLRGQGMSRKPIMIDTGHPEGWLVRKNRRNRVGFSEPINVQPVMVRINNRRARRMMPENSPNFVGGYRGNTVFKGVVGAVIAGGGKSDDANVVSDSYGVVSGGAGNRAGDAGGTVTDAVYATVGGGWSNIASGLLSTIGGGWKNTARASTTTISGGAENTASGFGSTVGGGAKNVSSGESSTISGGMNNVASSLLSTVGGGNENTASGFSSTVSGGNENTASGGASTVGGGQSNTASGNYSMVGGGNENVASGGVSTVSGGMDNIASGFGSTVCGGVENTATGLGSTICGGEGNTAAGAYSWVGGHKMYLAPSADRTFVWGYATSTTAVTVSDAFLIGPHGNTYRVGINNAYPTYALELPDNINTPVGKARANAWEVYSDVRVKSQIVDIGGSEALAKITALRPVYYFHHSSRRTPEGKLEILEDGEYRYGFIAQELVRVIPEAVTVPEDTTRMLYGVNYDELIPILTAALQAQQAEIVQLRQRVAMLQRALESSKESQTEFVALQQLVIALQQQIERLQQRLEAVQGQ